MDLEFLCSLLIVRFQTWVILIFWDAIFVIMWGLDKCKVLCWQDIRMWQSVFVEIVAVWCRNLLIQLVND